MAYTLYDATLDLAMRVGDVRAGTATSGSTTTLLDTVGLPATYFADNYYQYGTVWFPTKTGRAASSRFITTHSSGTVTMSPALSATVAASDAYRIANGDYPKDVLEWCINSALRQLGRLPFQDEMTAVANQVEYTTSDDTNFDNDIIEVEVSANTSSPYQYKVHQRWEQIVTASGRTLRFDYGTYPTAAVKLRWTYLDFHAELTSDAGVINSFIDPVLLQVVAAAEAYKWRYRHLKGEAPYLVQLLNDANQEKAAAQELALLNGKMQEARDAANQAVAKMGALVGEFIGRKRIRSARISRW